MLLSDVVAITSGQQVSAQPTDDYHPVPFPVALLQLSDFNNDGQPPPPSDDSHPSLAFRIKLASIPPAADKHLLQPGQILLTAKGARLFAACVQPEWLPALASTSFFVLTPQASYILPEFLTLFLNLPTTRDALSALFTTTTIPTLSRRSLLTLPLFAAFPPLERQQHAIELHRLWLKEKDLLLKYLPLREVQVYTSLQQLITQQFIYQ